MRYYKSKKKPTNNSKENKRAKILYWSFIIASALFVIHYKFIESNYIGSDYRYNLFVFWMPTLIGFFITIKYDVLQIDWKYFYSKLKEEKKFHIKIFVFVFMHIALFLFSAIMFWMPCNIIWDVLNKRESKKNKLEVFFIPVEKFSRSSKSSDRIYFYFENEIESIPVNYNDIKPYLDKNPRNYKVEIDVRKGIWNHYVLESYDIR